jgi:DNA-binding IclR family transcriptional regulator
MRELHKLIQQPVNLSMRQGDEIVYIERAYSERSGMQVVRAIGGRAPLAPDVHRQAVSGAADEPQRVSASYATRTGLAGHTRNSITQLPVLERELAQGRASTELRATMKSSKSGCAAWPPGIYDDQGKLIAGLSISAPADRLDDKLACPSCKLPPAKYQPRFGLQADRTQACEPQLMKRCCQSAATIGVDSRPSGALARRRPGG